MHFYEIQPLLLFHFYFLILKKHNHKNYSGLLGKQGLLSTKQRVLKDGNGYKDNALRKAGGIDDVRDGDIQRNSGFSNGAYEEKEEVLPQQEQGPALKINPEPKEPNFNKDKESAKLKKKAGVNLLPGKAMNGTGVGDTWDNRSSGTVYPSSGLGNVTYRESFDKFRNKMKTESIDDPGLSDMGTFGGMANGTNKEPMLTPSDKFSQTDIKKKKKKDFRVEKLQ